MTMTAHDRYRRDRTFAHLVDMLEFQIREANYTPSELREAAMLAAIHYEETRPRRYWVDRDAAILPREEPPYRAVHEPTYAFVTKVLTDRQAGLDVIKARLRETLRAADVDQREAERLLGQWAQARAFVDILDACRKELETP